MSNFGVLIASTLFTKAQNELPLHFSALICSLSIELNRMDNLFLKDSADNWFKYESADALSHSCESLGNVNPS